MFIDWGNSGPITGHSYFLGLGGIYEWGLYEISEEDVVNMSDPKLIHEYIRNILGTVYTAARMDITLLTSFVDDDIIVGRERRSFTANPTTGYVEADVIPSPAGVLYQFDIVYTDTAGAERVVSFEPVRVTTDARLSDITTIVSC